jgi:hypothetical protein
MDSTHIRWLEERLEINTVEKILKAENGTIGKDKESVTEKRNQRELLWFQTGGALNFITAAPHCGASSRFRCPSNTIETDVEFKSVHSMVIIVVAIL